MHDWYVGDAVGVLNRQNLNIRCDKDVVTDGDASLAADDTPLANDAVRSDVDERVGQIAEVVDMHERAVHDERMIADCDAAGRGVQVGTIIEVNAVPERNIA